MSDDGAVADPSLAAVLRLAIGIGGLAFSITILSVGMRAVMDVGGFCAEGGPYEIATHCPEGSAIATTLGMFGLFGFGAIGLWGGGQVGGGWGSVPLLAWTALFGVLGWNFLDYGIINPPEGESIVWGWLIPGVLFEAMAFGPLLIGIWALRSGRSTSRQVSGIVRPMPGPGQPNVLARPRASGSGAGPRVVSREPAEDEATREALEAVAAALGAAVIEAAAETPADPERRAALAAADRAAGDETGEFSEGTQALLDRLERLADMRDRGLLTPGEYETAKEAVMDELEARS